MKKYTLSLTAILRHWIRAYREFGLEGLKRKNKKSTYFVQFKVDVLHFMKQTGASYPDTAITFSMNRRFSTPILLQKLITDVTEFKCTCEEILYPSPMLNLCNSEVITSGINNLSLRIMTQWKFFFAF